MAIGVLVCGSAPASGQVTVPDTALVLSTAASVRFAGLNGAGAALVGHAGSVFANPAGLATIRNIALEGAYQTIPGAGAGLWSAALGWRLRQFDLGVGGRYHRFGDQPGVPADSYDALGVGSLVYRFGIIALGVSGKYLRRDRGTVVDVGTSGDAGITIAIFDIMAFGFAVQNIGGNWRSNSTIPMPRLSRLGFTINYVDPQESFRLLSTIEVQWLESEGSRFVFGNEAGMLIGRVGVIGRLSFGSRSENRERAPVTLGGTVALRWIDIDVAQETSELTNTVTRRLGVRLAL